MTDPFEEFLTRLFRHGRVTFREPPAPPPGPGPSRGAVAALASAFEAHRLDVAGPEIAFEPGVAAEAGRVTWAACWALVSEAGRAEALAHGLTTRRPPVTPSDHLSADLSFRYLPQIHRRARALGPADPLVGRLDALFRTWPLSGVLSDLDEGPATPPEFGGHPGLLLLYAERLAARPRDAWRPGPAGADHVELVAAAGRVRR